ncbi:BnaC03g63050D [Brassica napus]|uniref:BnaC03g63050D protein n=1 Tax=Brassica napus TaxID=3708 RepID=A0A078F455_BRANA|nr:BnaC03g63050D [Brassica napus]
MAIVSSLPLLAQGRTLGSLAYLPNAKLGSVIKECDIATMIKATIESLEGQLCSNEVMVRHELGQRISQTAMSDVLREV